MADDLLRSFYARYGRTLSIGNEVSQVLSRGDKTASENAMTRLDLELATWNAEIEAHDAYTGALAEFNAASAVWRHVGSIGTKPEEPAWPLILPQFNGIDYAFTPLEYLKKIVPLYRDFLKSGSFDPGRSSMSSFFALMVTSLDRIKGMLDEGGGNEAQEISDSKSEQQLEPNAIIESNFVTVEQMALLAGVGVGAMNNRLSQSRPKVEPIRPGGRKHNAYPWPEIREWMIKHWPHRPLPEDFHALQEILRELPPL